MRNIVFVHGGGPTAVINASLAGSLRELRTAPATNRSVNISATMNPGAG